METPGLKSHQSVPELVTPDKSGPAKSPGFKVLIAKKGVAQLGLDLRTESAWLTNFLSPTKMTALFNSIDRNGQKITTKVQLSLCDRQGLSSVLLGHMTLDLVRTTALCMSSMTNLEINN